MGLFEIAVNIAEAMLLAYFVHRVHRWKFDGWYVGVVSVLFVEEMVSSYIDSKSSFVIYTLIITSIIYQCIRFRKISFNYFLISAMSSLVVLFSNSVSLFIIQTILNLNLEAHFSKAIALSKAICFGLMYYSGSRINIGENEILHIWQFNVVVTLLLVIIEMDLQEIVSFTETGIEVYIRILVIGMLIVLLYRFLEQLIESNNQKIYYELELQKLTYENRNRKLVEDSQKEIQKLDHNLKYTMLSVLLHANTGNLDGVKEQANNYLGRLIMANHSVVTRNPYFDYVFNELDLEYKLHHVILKKQIEIAEHSVINTAEIANQIMETIKKLLDLAMDNKLNTVDVQIKEDGDLCFIYCIIKYNDYKTMKKYLENNFNKGYVSVFDSEYSRVKISLAIDIFDDDKK
jgi:hypothetical protein